MFNKYIMDNLLKKNDISLLLKIYKKYGHTKLQNMFDKNSLDLDDSNEIRILQKIINISSDPINLIKDFFDTYLDLVGGKKKGKGGKGRKKTNRKNP